MFGRIARTLWGDLSQDEVKKFGILTAAFFFIIGSYWTMRGLKDAVFMGVVGKTYLPYAKLVSLCTIVPLVMFYSKLIDWFEKDKLFYVICGTYVVLYSLYAFMLSNPSLGVANTETSPYRFLGWFIYITIESFGSLVVALFWSFVASTTDTASAKKGYAIVLGGAQVGSILGPTLNTKASVIGIPTIALISAICVALSIALIKLYMVKGFGNVVGTVAEKKKSTGMLEGLKLLASKPYLLGILGVATLYEVIGTIMDYQMKFAATAVYNTPEKVLEFFGFFGQCANIVPLIVGLLGASYIIRKFGLTVGLVLFPSLMSLLILNVLINPGLWSLFIAMVGVKGLSYGLNNPCKEIMYIPTSKDVKFKAKGWIDIFGGRTSKGAGSGINALFTEMSSLMLWGSVISLGIIAIWIPIAIYVGRTNNKLVEEHKIIE